MRFQVIGGRFINAVSPPPLSNLYASLRLQQTHFLLRLTHRKALAAKKKLKPQRQWLWIEMAWNIEK